MRFSGVLARAIVRPARTEWRTAPVKGAYSPGKSFGWMPKAAPAYLFMGFVFWFEWGKIAALSHQIMEGGVARMPLGKQLFFRLINRFWYLLAHG